MLAHAALILLLLAHDATPKGEDHVRIAVERLGNAFSHGGDEENDRGLAVTVWRNGTLKREERWHYTEKGEWFLQARAGLYVLAVLDTESGEWVTRPSERLVWRGGAWRRVTVPAR
jgi:hypothetical protein